MDHAPPAVGQSPSPIRQNPIQRFSMLHFTRLTFAIALVLAGGMMLSSNNLSSQEQSGQGPVVVADVTGAITVATTMHIESAIEEAKERGAELLVLRLNTPGGLVTSTRDITEAILASPVAVAVYVSPSGAHAASAGTYITYAGHIAAMAPGTQIGAATPIDMGGADPFAPQEEEKKEEPAKEGEGKDQKTQPTDATAADRKAVNDAVAFIKSLAQLRGRNVEWAEKAVREAATLTASEALEAKVIDLVASDVEDLLRQSDGRKVQVSGAEKTLATAGRSLAFVEIDWRTEFLSVISDPNIAYILLMIGIYGIIFEFWNPGFVAPGVIGAICLLVGLMALSVLPVNYAGLALILLGIALMVAEAFAPSFGIIGIGGVIAFVLGSVFLFDPGEADYGLTVAWPLIAAAAATSALFMFFVLGFALKARQRPVVAGSEELLGMTGTVVEWTGQAGAVRVHGEIWAASASRALAPGDQVRVIGRDGLTLQLESI
jgi:membrane-bound serine protease (ClpP class)